MGEFGRMGMGMGKSEKMTHIETWGVKKTEKWGGISENREMGKSRKWEIEQVGNRENGETGEIEK